MSCQKLLRKTQLKGARLDLVFVCPSCNLKMPHIPCPGGKKQCPRCGDPLSVVGTCLIPISESAKAAEELDNLLKEFESRSHDERLRATAAKCGSKSE